MLAQVDWSGAFEDAWRDVITFLPKLLGFLVVLVIGYVVARLIAKGLDALLERVGFDRAVERGGIRRAMARTQMDASDIVSKIVFYTLLLFVLQLAFGVFGPNPISELLQGVIAFLPKLLAAIVIVVIAAAIAQAVRNIVNATLGGLSYGRALATAAWASILAIGVFAALNQIEIAPAIVNGLFYALLAIVAGSAIIAIGGGGIQPMRQQWERALNRVEREAPRAREEMRSRRAASVVAQQEEGGMPAQRPPTEPIRRPEDTEEYRRPA